MVPAGSALSVRGSRVVLAAAWLLFVAAWAPSLAQAPARIEVEGRPITAGGALPTLRGGQLWVPLLPIARELLDEITVDAAGEAVTARLAHTGEIRTFRRQTGQIVREGAILAVVPGSTDVVVTPNPADLRVPLEVLSALLDVAVTVEGDGEAGVLSVRRAAAVAPATSVRSTGAFALGRLDYMAYFDRRTPETGAGLRVGAEGLALDSSFVGYLEGSGGSLQGSPAIDGGMLTITRPSRQAWTIGDTVLSPACRFLAGPVRGVALEQPIGSSELRAFAGGALSGVEPGIGLISRRLYETEVASVLWDSASLAQNRPGLGFGFGTTAFSGAESEAVMAVHHLASRTRQNHFVLDAAAGWFDDLTDREGSAFDGALEIADSLLLGRHSVTMRGAWYGDHFATPIENPSLRGRSFVEALWSGPVAPGLTAGLGLARNWTRVPIAFDSTNWSVSFNYNDYRTILPEISAYYSESRSDAGTTMSNALVDMARTIGDWRPFLTWSRSGTDVATFDSFSGGTNVFLVDAGLFRVAGRGSAGGSRGATLDWSSPLLARGRMQVSAGVGYDWQTGDLPGDESDDGRLSSRLAVQGRVAGGHAVQLSYFDTGYEREVLVTVTGPIVDRPIPVQVARGPGASLLVLSSRVVGRLFEDTDRDGWFNPATDRPLRGARLWLDSSTVATTDAAGRYRFDGVMPGERALRVELESVSAMLTPNGGLTKSLHVPPRSEYSVDFAFLATGGIGGIVFLDVDRDGTMDPGEPAVPDVRVLCACGRDTLTTVDGTFILGDLPPGEVSLTLDLQGLPAMHRVEPEQLVARVTAGRQTYGLRIAVQAVDRPVQERVAQVLAPGGS